MALAARRGARRRARSADRGLAAGDGRERAGGGRAAADRARPAGARGARRRPEAADGRALRRDVAALVTAIRAGKPLLLVGERGSGRLSRLRAAAGELARDGWMTFEAGAAEVNAGMTYVGELEGRVRHIVRTLDRESALWIVPAVRGAAVRRHLPPEPARRARPAAGGLADAQVHVAGVVEPGRLRAAGAGAPAGARRVRRRARGADGRAAHAGARRPGGSGHRSGRAARGARARPPFPRRRGAAGRAALAAGGDAPPPAGRRPADAGRRAGDDHRALRAAGVAARRARAARRRRAACVLHVARDRPARGGRVHDRARRAAQGGADRSDAPAGRAAVRRPDRDGQDRDRQGAGRVPVRVRRPDDPARPERVPEPGLGAADARRRRARGRVAGRADPAPAVLGRAARRVREGRPGRLRPVPAGLRRRPAERSARRARGLPPRRDHHDLEPGREGRDRRARVLAGVRVQRGQRRAGRHARLPARVPEPDRPHGRLPAAVARRDARDPRRRARGGAGAARAARAPVGGRVRRLGARVPARRGLHAGPRRAAVEAGGRAPLPDAAGAGDRRPRLPGRRPVPVRARRWQRAEGDVRGPGRGLARGRFAAALPASR